MTEHTRLTKFACDAFFLPLADPERLRRDPLRALAAAKDLELLLTTSRQIAVTEARRAGWTWENIGECLGITRQAAHDRYAQAAAVVLTPATRWPQHATGAP
jgi:DNA-binding NarL/FixJ family response regulator